jgi:hypothetical protein
MKSITHEEHTQMKIKTNIRGGLAIGGYFGGGNCRDYALA